MPLYRRLPKRGFRSIKSKDIALINLSKYKILLIKRKYYLTQK